MNKSSEREHQINLVELSVCRRRQFDNGSRDIGAVASDYPKAKWVVKNSVMRERAVERRIGHTIAICTRVGAIIGWRCWWERFVCFLRRNATSRVGCFVIAIKLDDLKPGGHRYSIAFRSRNVGDQMWIIILYL